MQILVNDIFSSIQGEGFRQGHPAVFLRTQGCNLNCEWCDTKQALGEGGHFMDVEDIALELIRAPEPLVVITGGEPLRWPKQLEQLLSLMHLSKLIHLETNGTLPIPTGYTFMFDWITVSPKPPKYYIHPGLTFHEIKIVVDGIDAIAAAQELSAMAGHARMSLQPVNNDPEMIKLILRYLPKLAAVETGSLYFNGGLRWKISLQLHKIIKVK